jgi:hypothetical protein
MEKSLRNAKVSKCAIPLLTLTVAAIKKRWLHLWIHKHNIMFLAHHASADRDKGKAIPIQAWTGPEDSRRLKLPDFKTIGT